MVCVASLDRRRRHELPRARDWVRLRVHPGFQVGHGPMGLAGLAGSERGIDQASVAGPHEVEGVLEGTVGQWERKRES